MPDRDLNIPKEDKGDIVHAIVRGSIGAVPIAGSLAAEVFGLVLNPPVMRRRDEWMQETARRLKQLEEKEGVSLTSLATNETFIDCVLQATQAALKTQSKLKKAVLVNAVLNSPKISAPDAATQHMFLSFIDRFTDWHIMLLLFFKEPTEWAGKHNVTFPQLMAGPPSAILEVAFPELITQKEFYRQIWRDLHATGLVNADSLGGTLTWSGIISKRTTEFGDKFLGFISGEELTA